MRLLDAGCLAGVSLGAPVTWENVPVRLRSVPAREALLRVARRRNERPAPLSVARLGPLVLDACRLKLTGLLMGRCAEGTSRSFLNLKGATA